MIDMNEVELSEKQAEYIANANHRWNGKVGATQCGKTYVDTLFVIPDRIRERKGKKGLNFITGVSKETITRNVIEPLQEIYGSRAVTDISSNNTCKILGEKVYCIGADNVGRVRKFRGPRIKYLYIDEAYDINEEVFQLLKSRLSFEYSTCDFAGNPQHLTHWFEKFINSDADIYLQRYTIFDNPFLPPEYVKQLCIEYKGTVFYDRYILGKACNAEGIIYKQFADNPKLFMREKAVDENGNKLNFMIISLGIDYGASDGKTKFTANGITTMFKQLWTIDEMTLSGLHTPEQMYEKFVEFYWRVVNEYGKVTHAFGDWGALGEVLTFGLNRYLQQHNIPLQVKDCIKGRIVDRIQLDCSLFGQGRRFILNKCKQLKEAYEQAVWSDKEPDTRLDDGTSDIDSLDSSEYASFPFYDKLMMNIQGR